MKNANKIWIDKKEVILYFHLPLINKLTGMVRMSKFDFTSIKLLDLFIRMDKHQGSVEDFKKLMYKVIFNTLIGYFPPLYI